MMGDIYFARGNEVFYRTGGGADLFLTVNTKQIDSTKTPEEQAEALAKLLNEG